MLWPRPPPGLPWIGPDPPWLARGCPGQRNCGMGALASAWSGGVSASRPFARPRGWYWMAPAGKPCSREQPALAPGSLRSASVRLPSPSVVIGGADQGRQGAEPEPAVRDPQVASLAGRNGPRARRAVRGGRARGQPAVVGMGAGEAAAGDVGPADAAAAGPACPSAVVVTGPAELPVSQAGQGCCQ